MIYADYNGSAPLSAEVITYLNERFEKGPFANPNAIHSLGKKIAKGIENCRDLCAQALGAKSEQIIFNSGASEGISQIFHSVLSDGPVEGRNIIIISALEHSAVVQAARSYQTKGFDLRVLPSTPEGVIEIDTLETWLAQCGHNVALVSIMAANNETGVVEPFYDITKLCQKYSIPYFSDTTQFIGKSAFHFEESGMDFAVCSGHKLGALPGSGLVLAKDPKKLKALIHGGGQENDLRGGTQNYFGIESIAVAITHFSENIDKLERLNTYREEFEASLKEKFPEIVIFGDKAKRLPNTTFLSYPGIHGQVLQIELEAHNIFVSTSSACSDNDPRPSKVLRAMGMDDATSRGAIRIGLGLSTTKEDYNQIEKALTTILNKLKQINSF